MSAIASIFLHQLRLLPPRRLLACPCRLRRRTCRLGFGDPADRARLGHPHPRVPTIVAAFSQHLPRYDFAAKFAFTSLTLGSGFKGGEVTPLFFIGATPRQRALQHPAAALLAVSRHGIRRRHRLRRQLPLSSADTAASITRSGCAPKSILFEAAIPRRDDAAIALPPKHAHASRA